EANVTAGINKLLSINGKRSVRSFHREIGRLLWDKCGMARDKAGLEEALAKLPAIRKEFWTNVKVTGENGELNQELEYAGRVADYIDFAEIVVRDALARDESCGCHYRKEHSSPDGECVRDDSKFSHVAVWEYQGEGQAPLRHAEPLVFEEVHPGVRSYK
ncbi:MAG: fumarate reductase/succinate dehydrogenase flavoprotein subunit, partial [Verrucomicrobiae bacterium]|nr:fumarate reductase/succinate dehydrogenase flavoprotein subunit [Verrucomicrobiae bacterium]